MDVCKTFELEIYYEGIKNIEPFDMTGLMMFMEKEKMYFIEEHPEQEIFFEDREKLTQICQYQQMMPYLPSKIKDEATINPYIVMNDNDYKEIVYSNNLGKVLVVYYSLSGKTKEIAENIAHKTNADLFEIKTTDKLNTNAKFYLEIKKQLKSKKYPLLEENIPDFSKYDTVFVGFPVWWYTIATPVLSFLEKAMKITTDNQP